MNPERVVTIAVVVGFGLMAALLFRTLGTFAPTRRKLMEADLQNHKLAHENQTLRQQIEKDRNEDRARRGDYAHVYDASYREVRQCKKTGQWTTVREVNP